MSNTSRKLSSEEVSALMEGLKSGEINSGDGLNNDIEVTSFTFGSDNLELMGDYYALRLINERFSRMVRGIFLPMLRLQPKINPFPPGGNGLIFGCNLSIGKNIPCLLYTSDAADE